MMASSLPPLLSFINRRKHFGKKNPPSHCTHRTMTRLYDHYGCLKCSICGRSPDLGFLYRCTQDTDGVLPIADLIDQELSIDLGELSIVRDSTLLDTTNNTSAMASSFPTNTSLHTNTTSNSDHTMDTEMAIDEALARAHDGKRKFGAAFPLDSAEAPKPCNHKVCHNCRPIYKDRAWQSLDRVVNNPDFTPPYDLANRRVSDAATIMGIGENKDINVPAQNAQTSLSSSPVQDKSWENEMDIDISDESLDLQHRARPTHTLPGIMIYAEGDCSSDADDEAGSEGEDESNDEAYSEKEDTLFADPHQPALRRTSSNQWFTSSHMKKKRSSTKKSKDTKPKANESLDLEKLDE